MNEQRKAIRAGPGNTNGANVTCTTSDAFYRDGLAQRRGHVFANDAGRKIYRAPRSIGDNDRDWPVVLGEGNLSNEGICRACCGCSACCQVQKSASCKTHRPNPRNQDFPTATKRITCDAEGAQSGLTGAFALGHNRLNEASERKLRVSLKEIATEKPRVILCERYAQKSGEQTDDGFRLCARLDGQTLAAQDAALHAAGCAKLYSETASGARSDRPRLGKVLRLLREDDTLIVTRLEPHHLRNGWYLEGCMSLKDKKAVLQYLPQLGLSPRFVPCAQDFVSGKRVDKYWPTEKNSTRQLAFWRAGSAVV